MGEVFVALSAIAQRAKADASERPPLMGDEIWDYRTNILVGEVFVDLSAEAFAKADDRTKILVGEVFVDGRANFGLGVANGCMH